MPKSAGKTMNVLRWIFGIPLAFLLAFGLLYIWVIVDTNPSGYSFSFPFVFHILGLVLTFAMPVFLSSLFTPRPKKYGALTAITLVILFIAFIECYEFFLSTKEEQRSISIVFIGSYLAFMAGGSVGFAVSYIVFKNKGWNRELPPPEMPEGF